jgi:hypothetical protein
MARPRADPARKRLPLDETRPTPVLSDGELSAFVDGRDRERERIPAIRMQGAARIVTSRNQSAAQREYGRVAAPREAQSLTAVRAEKRRADRSGKDIFSWAPVVQPLPL